jgi:hypothetical protein
MNQTGVCVGGQTFQYRPKGIVPCQWYGLGHKAQVWDDYENSHVICRASYWQSQKEQNELLARRQQNRLTVKRNNLWAASQDINPEVLERNFSVKRLSFCASVQIESDFR